MTIEKKESDEIKVVDRRRFDDQGDERVEKESASSSKSASAHNTEISSQESELPKLDFSGFIMSFATQALMQLGEIKAPQGSGIEVDRVAAKQTIDILELLDSKTRGNLDPTEKALFEEILHNLRLTYVRVLKR